MAFDTLENASFSLVLMQTAKTAAAGRKPTQASDKCDNKITWTLGTAAGAINEAYVGVLTLGASTNTTLDLQALIDVVGNALNFTGIKAIFLQLLGTIDTAPDGTTVGTICTGVTIGNAAANPFGGAGYPLGDAAAQTITLANREQFGRGKPSAAGWVVDGTHRNLKFLNNDAVNQAKILVGLQGIG
jgi:hypothetical protein